MGIGLRYRILISLALTASATGASAQGTDSLPPGVTGQMVAKGKALFGSDGLCFACHGQDAKGTTGPNLTDQVWIHSQGSYPEIVTQIRAGVSAEKSKSGVVMPPNGGADLSDEQVKAVAAYVWSLSHRSKRPVGR